MKRIFSLILSLALLFSMSGCMLIGVEFTVTDGTLSVSDTPFTPTITLVGDEDKDITSTELWEKLVEAIDGKPVDESPVYSGIECECETEYILRVKGNYAKGYYLTLHEDGIEISGYCKYRKCMDLMGIVRLDKETVSELIKMLEE